MAFICLLISKFLAFIPATFVAFLKINKKYYYTHVELASSNNPLKQKKLFSICLCSFAMWNYFENSKKIQRKFKEDKKLEETKNKKLNSKSLFLKLRCFMLLSVSDDMQNEQTIYSLNTHKVVYNNASN